MKNVFLITLQFLFGCQIYFKSSTKLKNSFSVPSSFFNVVNAFVLKPKEPGAKESDCSKQRFPNCGPAHGTPGTMGRAGNPGTDGGEGGKPGVYDMELALKA